MVPFRSDASAELRFGLIARDHVKFRRCFAGCTFARLLSASLNGANENAVALRTVMVYGQTPMLPL